MSVKATMKGFITLIHPTEGIGEKKTKIQRVEFMTPAWRDEFGEVKGNDEFWLLTVMGKKVDEFDLDTVIAPNTSYKAEITVYFNGRKFFLKDDVEQKVPYYGVEGNINELRLIK